MPPFQLFQLGLVDKISVLFNFFLCEIVELALDDTGHFDGGALGLGIER